MDTLCKIIVICANHGVAEIPSVFFKYVVGRVEAKRPKVQNQENGGGAGIALAENVNLPKP